MTLLDSIKSPKDLKQIPVSKLPQLCAEIREFLIHTLSQTGGHLASNLGTIELTVALHYAFESPKDRFIWDVGHQTYTHKILTGRKNKMHTVRKYKGLSGFPKHEESAHDHYNAGHAGTSISQAIGEAVAKKLSGKNDKNIISIIGDASIATGMAFEAMNHAGHLQIPFLVILNDNEMSISKNVGSLSYILTSMINTKFYKDWRHQWIKCIHKLPIFGDILERIMLRFRSSMKSILTEHQFFEELGFRYLGPLDGHDVVKMVSVFNKLKLLYQPTILHVVTKKGKGYEPAEVDPVKFHGVGAFEKDTGKMADNGEIWPLSEFVGRTLSALAEKDAKLCVITPAMGEGSGLTEFARRFPDRFFDTGIAEQHAATFSAALANSGLKPFLCIYSTFLQRGFDQIVHDTALMNLPVRLVIDRAGIVGGDGETHHGLYDIAYLNCIPNLTLLSASDNNELIEMLNYMKDFNDGPVAVRFAKDNGKKKVFTDWADQAKAMAKVQVNAQAKTKVKTKPEKIRPLTLRKGKDAVIFAEGTMVQNALKAAEILEKDKISLEVVSLRILKPLDAAFIEKAVSGKKRVFTLENHVHSGGAGMYIQSLLKTQTKTAGIKIYSLAYPDAFIEHGGIGDLQKQYNLHAEGVASFIKKRLK